MQYSTSVLIVKCNCDRSKFGKALRRDNYSPTLAFKLTDSWE